MTGLPRWVALPLAAIVLVVGLIGVQISAGGGSYEPLRPRDACDERVADSRAEGIEGLTERLVLIGLADSACTLGLSREGLTLELAQPGPRTDAEIEALREGLTAAVGQLNRAGTLPRSSELADEALEEADLNRFLETALRAVPNSVIDRAVPTEDVLTRAIADLDLRRLLTRLDSPDELNDQVEQAVTQAVKDSLIDRLRGLI